MIQKRKTIKKLLDALQHQKLSEGFEKSNHHISFKNTLNLYYISEESSIYEFFY